MKKKTNQENLEFANWCKNTLAPDLKESGYTSTAKDIVELVDIIQGLNKQLPKINHIDSDFDPEQCSALFSSEVTADMNKVDRALSGYPIYRYATGSVHQWVYNLGCCDCNIAENLKRIIIGTLNVCGS